MREDHEVKGALRLFSVAFLAIIVGSTGRDAEFHRITRMERANADAFAGCMEPKLDPEKGPTCADSYNNSQVRQQTQHS